MPSSLHIRYALVAVLAGLVLPSTAFAYVDPGLGGQLFQAAYLVVIGVLGFLVAPILLFGKRMVRRIRSLRRIGKPEPRPERAPDEPENQMSVRER